MFKNPFSFDGRIRRSEYGISLILYFIAYAIVLAIVSSAGRDGGAAIVYLFFIPMLWFMFAQGAKRCHDVGNSGWWQLIPFYMLWLIFEEGQPLVNPYGQNPKGIITQSQQNSTQSANSQGGYQGGYSGGHNNPNSSYGSSENPQNKDGYKDGDLYK